MEIAHARINNSAHRPPRGEGKKNQTNKPNELNQPNASLQTHLNTDITTYAAQQYNQNNPTH